MAAPIFDSIQAQLGSVAATSSVSHGTLVVEIAPPRCPVWCRR